MEAYPSALASSIDFMKDEVIEICGALALEGTLLRRLGLGAEAARLEVLFSAVQERLTEQVMAPSAGIQPASVSSGSVSAPPSLPGS